MGFGVTLFPVLAPAVTLTVPLIAEAVDFELLEDVETIASLGGAAVWEFIELLFSL